LTLCILSWPGAYQGNIHLQCLDTDPPLPTVC